MRRCARKALIPQCGPRRPYYLWGVASVRGLLGPHTVILVPQHAARKGCIAQRPALGESSLFPPSTGESATLEQRELCDACRLSVLTQRRGQLTHSSPHQPTRAVTFDPLFALNVIQNCSFFSSAACAVQCSAPADGWIPAV